MPDFTARAPGFAVQVDFRIGEPAPHLGHALWHGHVRVVGSAQHVRHHRGLGEHVCRAERQIQHGPQVLLELAGHTPVLRPVASVVGAHGQLVDPDALGILKQFHR